MAVTDDILESYRRPRAVIRRKLDAGVREDRALATLFSACALIFVSQWPALSRAAYLEPEVPLDARMGVALVASLFVAPLVFYLVAAISHLAARAAGGAGSFFSARMALFWALLAIAPLMLLNGLARGFLDQGVQTHLVGVIVLAAFLYLWGTMLHEAEKR